MNNSYLNLVVGFNELLKPHLLLQVEAKLFQAAEDAVVMVSLTPLVLSTPIYSEAQCVGAQTNGNNY